MQSVESEEYIKKNFSISISFQFHFIDECEKRGVCNIYLLLTEFECRTVSYGPSFFGREARGP